MKRTFSRVFIVVLLAAWAAACSSGPAIVSEWRNPVYPSGSFKRVMVGGPIGEVSVRRTFEDEFVSQLRAAGIDGLASYRFISEDQPIDETRLKQAAQRSDADAVIFVRSLQVQRRTETPAVVPSTSFGWFGGNWGISWHSLFGGYSATSYNEYTSETTLFDLAKQDVVWTGTIRTRETDKPRGAIQSYVTAVMKALEDKNLLRRAT